MFRDEKAEKKGRFTPIENHQRYKSFLKPPLSESDNLYYIDWERDQLPEYLWIDLLSYEYKRYNWEKIYHLFLDKLEKFLNSDVCFFGFITDFGYVPEKMRENFISKYEEFIYKYFFIPVGKILTLYPENPASWLLIDKWKNKEKINPFIELGKLNQSLKRLINGKESHASHLRVVSSSRAFKHGKIRLKKDLQIDKILLKYPSKCDEKERRKVHSFARALMNQFYINEERYKDKKWPKYFWRHNYDLVPCTPCSGSLEKSDSEALNKDSIIKVKDEFYEEYKNLIKYLDKIGMQYKYDLYDNLRDEILLGLFSRVLNLYLVFAFDQNLWPRNTSGIFLRCMVDTAITFTYLVKLGEEKDFKNFYNYSIGREKLIMLHLQDTFKRDVDLQGKSYEEISKELGGFEIETKDINLSSGWSKKSTRELAKLSGMEKIYKLVFDPASSELHGYWTSIKKSNLVHCTQILHRFHRIPRFFVPPIYFNTLKVAQDIYRSCLEVGLKYLNFPKPDKTLIDFNLLRKKLKLEQ